MVNRIVVGADSFSIHGKFDEQGMFLLMEEGDILSDEDFARIVTFVDDHRNGDIFLLPKKYGPSRNSKKGIMYAPFSAYREKGKHAPWLAQKLDRDQEFHGVYEQLTNGVISTEILRFLHGFTPFGMVFKGSLLNQLMEIADAGIQSSSAGIQNDGQDANVTFGSSAHTLEDVLVKGSFPVLKWLLAVQARACLDEKLYYIDGVDYTLKNSFEGDKTFFEGIYDRAWYKDTVDQLIEWLKEMSIHQETLQMLVMQHALFIVKYMIQANLDNLNKHLFEGADGEAFLWKLGEVLSYIDDSIICENQGYHVDMKNEDCLVWVFLILKYKDTGLEFDFADGCYSYNDIQIGELTRPTADIQFMDNKDMEDHTELTIEGRLSPILLMNRAEFGVLVGDRFYPAEYNERYAHTKAFGMSIFKLRAFTIRVELPYGQETELAYVTRVRADVFENGETMGMAVEDLPVTLEFDSHFSRLCDRFRHSYWKINKKLYMYKTEANIMKVDPVKHGKIAGRELALWRDMFATGQKKVIKFIIVRAFLKAKPVLKHRPIWLFFDKIYKAGDSAEYMYKYARSKKDGIKCYYLADGASEDYARLEREGMKPVKRRSIKHRYAFLYADMVIVSNSTVYAFNDFGTINSALIRDLMNFHVACVQHGMSIQKIAVAQNRLRDNTRLYFCASKYEIENLSKPIYGYEGYDALKLTGVPRYDGLINEDKRQILLSPTWRMQAAVPVTKNEGVSRDYNPLFKETTYYRVYNSLINDERLIAAAKKYNYKIVYVLHPIVSPQIDDFDKNPSVEIIPAVAVHGHSGVNYEKVFRESSLMVSDFSGVQFDFAYMRKPVVYLHHHDIPKHYEEGTFHYDTMGFGEICQDNDELIDVLISYMQNNCEMKPEYRRRADDFFRFDDHDNCERIYDVMIDYQKTKIH